VIVAEGGGPFTTTTVLHEAVALSASTALHVTGVEPTGNSEPEAGEQPVVTGAVPPATVVLTGTLTGFPSVEVAVGALQMTDSGVAGVGVWPLTSLEYALNVEFELYACTTK